MPCKYVNTCMWCSRDYAGKDPECHYLIPGGDAGLTHCEHPNLTKTQEWPADAVTTAKNRRIIRLSNLALRFYKSDGWTKELVDSFIISGPKSKDRFPADGNPYYSIDMQTQLSDKVLNNCVLQHCWFWSASERRRTDMEILKDYGHLSRESWEKL